MKIDIDKFIEDLTDTKGGNLNIRCKGLMLDILRGMGKNKSDFTRECMMANPELVIALNEVKNKLEERSKELCLKYTEDKIKCSELLPTLQALETVEAELIKSAKACEENFQRVDNIRKMNLGI